MIDLRLVPSRLNEIDRTLTERFRHDVYEECQLSVTRAVDAYDAWLKDSTETLDAERHALERAYTESSALAATIEASGAALQGPRPDRGDLHALSTFNRLVDDHNALVSNYRALGNDYTARQNEYNRHVTAHEQEAQRRHVELEATRRTATVALEEYNAWRAAHGEELFFEELNRLYAELQEGLANAGDAAGSVKAYLNQVRVVRRELATFARRREQEADHGVLIVPAVLGDDEECHLVVDSGATTVAISPELIRAAGLSSRLGDETEVVLAGGVHVRGRRLVLPRLSVQGMHGVDVEAVQLPVSQCGVDGLLGLSFLNQFDYIVEREKPQRLRLTLKGEGLDAYDVFISYNSRDEWWARVVFDALTVLKYRPFLSDVSLRRLGDDDFTQAIESAVAAARHMVVIGTSRENMNAPWVQKEWRMFERFKLTRAKAGNIITILCGDMTLKDVPHALGGHQSVSIFERDFRERLRDFLPLV